MKSNKNNSERRWNRKGLPHKGWQCKGVVDLRAEQGDYYEPEVCEMCGKEGLRFVHAMSHPKCKEKLNVGCNCTEKMSSNYKTPKKKEQRLHNLFSRRQRWPNLNWKTSQKGILYLNKENHNITICEDRYCPGGYKFRIVPKGEDPIYDPRTFAIIYEAKMAAFDWMAKKLKWSGFKPK